MMSRRADRIYDDWMKMDHLLPLVGRLSIGTVQKEYWKQLSVYIEDGEMFGEIHAVDQALRTS